jgi:hypothetical protein
MGDEAKELGEGLGIQAFDYGTVADHIKKYKVTCIETWGMPVCDAVTLLSYVYIDISLIFMI